MEDIYWHWILGANRHLPHVHWCNAVKVLVDCGISDAVAVSARQSHGASMRDTLQTTLILGMIIAQTGCGKPVAPAVGFHSQTGEGSQHPAKRIGASQAVEDALDGKSVNAVEYQTTNDEIFAIFKAKWFVLTEKMEHQKIDRESAKLKAKSLVRAMERVDPSRPDTVKFRNACKEVGFLD